MAVRELPRGQNRFRPELALTHLRLAELLVEDETAAARSEARTHLDIAIAELKDMQPALGTRAARQQDWRDAAQLCGSAEKHSRSVFALGGGASTLVLMNRLILVTQPVRFAGRRKAGAGRLRWLMLVAVIAAGGDDGCPRRDTRVGALKLWRSVSAPSLFARAGCP